MQTANFLMGTSTIGAKANQLKQAFKPQQANIPSWGAGVARKKIPVSAWRSQQDAFANF